MKTIALLPIRNEAWILASSLGNISRWADIIIVADQMSTDGSREICARSPKVTLIDNKNQGHSNKVRWDLLAEARKHEGNNLIVCIDTDEILADGPLFDEAYLAKQRPGQCFEMPWIQLWKTPSEYRTDSGWDSLTKLCAFIDDRKMDYDRRVVINDHTARIPASSLPVIRLETPLLHLEYVPFRKSQMKQAWYRCSELIVGARSARRINATYAVTKDGPGVTTEKVPANWMRGIAIPADLAKTPPAWHKDQILSWFDERGIEFFEPLDIWHVEELRAEFTKRTGREPRPSLFLAWIIALNKLKNRIFR